MSLVTLKMATANIFESKLLILLFEFSLISGQFDSYDRPITLVSVTKCEKVLDTWQFYDTSKLSCQYCSQNDTFQTTSVDGLSCVCKHGFKYTEKYGGRGITCTRCTNGQVASSSGYSCVSCPSGTNNVTNTCAFCSDPQNITVERNLVGNMYTSNGFNTVQCQTCSADTTPNAERTRCEKCTNVLPVTENNSCTCPTTLYGGFCIPASDLSQINTDTSTLYTIPRTTKPSAYFEKNLIPSYILCQLKNITACQVLSNLCVMTWYEYNPIYTVSNSRSTTACEMYWKFLKVANSFAPVDLPWLYYVQNGGDAIKGTDILNSDKITTQFTFSPASYLNYRVARYSLDGQFLGLHSVLNGRIQLCADTSKKQNAAFLFGTMYSQSCKIAAINFWDQTKYPMEFMDPYLELTQDGVQKLYAIPVNILNYRSLRDASKEINRGAASDMLLFRRFYLVDNIGSITAGGSPSQYVRYAKSLTIHVELQADTTTGVIYPPYFTIEYASVSYEDAVADNEVDVSFSVEYSYTASSYLKDFQIAVGTLSTLAVIYAGYRTWVWNKRAGRQQIDFPTIANFFFFCAGALANVFFVISFGIAFYWFIFFKRQSVVYLVHPSSSQLKNWTGLFGAAFALKFLEVTHLIFMQCMTDIFFIDWERSKGTVGGTTDTNKAREMAVSIWRTYFVANEWNEIQTVRKINKTFQVWAVVFFLVVVGFEKTATKDPDGSVNKDPANYQAEYSPVYRYAVAVLVYIIIGIVQWIFFVLIYERFFEDKVRQFVDLCSMSNISVFIMANAWFGYYIHGRSVHGKADTNLREMYEMMNKEADNKVSQRGLLPNTEEQTFIMSLPKKLRVRYEAVLLPAQLEGASLGARNAGQEKAFEKQVAAYSTINRFLSAFIDRSWKDMDYVIKSKKFLESVMDTEFENTEETGIFYNDNGHSFDNVLFYGNERTLMLFDILTFCVADLIFQNFVVAGVITYLISEFMCMVRNSGGQKNLSKKTLVDERFLI